MTTKELINQYVTAHADNRWMDASELEALLTEFAEKLMANQPKTREALFREYMQATPAERRKFDLSLLSETRKEALAILTDLGYECKLPQEPVSEDLEDALKAKVDEELKDPVLGKLINSFAAYTFAKQIVNWQKEQMMKDAIECTVFLSNGRRVVNLGNVDVNAEFGDKVKVIIIRSE